MPSSTSVVKAVIGDDPQFHEDVHVHAVYDQIASHFSSTRYKPWPIISQFLSDIPTGWVGLDSGTGNGKYLPLPLDRPGSVWTIGLDRSRELLKIAKSAGSSDSSIREVVWGDILGNGWRAGSFDYAISIATIHHLATYERRKLAVQRLLQCVSRKHGRILIYVWAVEQDELSTRSIPTDPSDSLTDNSPSGRMGEDVFVPWVLTTQTTAKAKGGHPASSMGPFDRQADNPSSRNEQQIYKRYYHMFAKGELPNLVSDAVNEAGWRLGPPKREGGDVHNTTGVEIVKNGWERSNYYVELRCWQT